MSEHALILEFPKEVDSVTEQAIRGAIEAIGAEFDGWEVGESVTRFYCYGPDAQLMWETVDSVLTDEMRAEGANVHLRSGSADDPAAQLEVISLSDGTRTIVPPASQMSSSSGGQPAKPGDWLVIPMFGRGFAVARVAARSGVAMVLYLFDEWFDSVPAVSDLNPLTRLESFKQIHCGGRNADPGGDYLVLDGGDSYVASQWPVPHFAWEDHRGVTWKVTLNDELQEIRPHRKMKRREIGMFSPMAYGGAGVAEIHILKRVIATGSVPGASVDWAG